MPATMNETTTAGPAPGTATDSTKKMPVPTVAPTPNIVSWKVPIVRLRWSEAPCATGAPMTGRRRSICSVREIDGAVMGASCVADLADYEPASASTLAN